jgi:hypothetical protein
MRFAMLARLVAGVLAAIVTMLPVAAHGVASDATRNPEVLWPLATPKVAICGRFGDASGIRPFAREVDQEIPGLRIFTGRHACRDHPHAVRARVRERHYGDTGWYAQTVFARPDLRVVEINLDLPNDHPHAVVCHEFGHVLGLQHHRRLGVDGRRPNMTHLSRAEVRALRQAYPRERNH